MKKLHIANRGHLKRLIARGLIEARCKYHYTDDYAFDNAANFGKTDWLPAYLDSAIPEGEQVDGIIFRENKRGWNDFKSRSGGLWENKEAGTYTFLIHSNLSYEVRLKEAKEEDSSINFEELLQNGSIENFEHTKTGEILRVLKLATKLSKEQFKTFNAWLKEKKMGYYSRYAHGFILNEGAK